MKSNTSCVTDGARSVAHRIAACAADEFGYRLVINHGTEGFKLADVLAEREIPVIFGPMITSRSKVELRDRAIANLAALSRAGVKVAITTDHPVVPINLLVLQASLAVRGLTSAFPTAQIALDGWMENALMGETALAVEERYRDLLRTMAQVAWQSGQSLPSWHDQAKRLAETLASGR